jgi:hypothetical protein
LDRELRRVAASLTFSSPSRHEDSFCKTAMARREDIVSCIDVTIMDRSAHSALPSPYSKIFPAFGAGAAVTHAAGLGGKRFIDLRKPHACDIALVLQRTCTSAWFEMCSSPRQFVAVIEDGVDLARQAAKPGGVSVLHPQAQDPVDR